jgi:hypothetical protein
MRTLIDSLVGAQTHSQQVLDQANNLGMDVSQAEFDLNDVTNALTKARTAIHSFRADSVAAQVKSGLKTVAGATRQGNAALDEHSYRRLGLAISVPIILVLAAALWLRLRMIEADQKAREEGEDAAGGREP